MSRFNPKFRASNGQFYTKSLFDQGENQIYTLSDVDNGDILSLRRLYIEMADPTEYHFASTYLDSWRHWQMLCSTNWFKKHLAEWRAELDAKIKADALKQIQEEASDPMNRGYMAANRYLADKLYREKTTEEAKAPSRGRGRPKKVSEPVKHDPTTLKDDADRVFGKFNNTKTRTLN